MLFNLFIIRGRSIGQVINKGVQKLPASYLGANYAKEVVGQTQVRQSIFRTSTLPVQYKPVEYKPEIGGGVGVGVEFGAGAVAGAGYRSHSASRYSLRSRGVINAGTTVRPSIIRNSVLPTINQGTTYLKSVFGGTKSTIIQPGEAMKLGLTTQATQLAPTPSLALGQPTTSVLGATTTSTLGLGATTTSTVGYGTVTASQVGLGAQRSSPLGKSLYRLGVFGHGMGNVLGIGTAVGDNAPDVTYSTKPERDMIYM